MTVDLFELGRCNTTFCLYFLKKLLLAQFKASFGRSNRDAFLENKGKIHEGKICETFFRKLTGWHLATSLEINLFTDNLQGFWVNERLRMATSRVLVYNA